ncbi:MAG: GC-type dockerin domain-anchored protein, partial [Phycisphaerales bacterium]
SVWVGQTCLADINLDGQVDFFDTSEFVKWFQRGRYEADLNGDGELDFFDVTAFIVGYQQGCP